MSVNADDACAESPPTQATSPLGPFDLDLAEYPVRVTRVDEIIDLLHVTHWPQRVEQYREAMRCGARFPPVSVVRFAGRLFLADGHKRLTAYRALGAVEIPVEVWTRRRWLRDQWRQFAARTRMQWALLRRGFRDPAAAREQGARLLRLTVLHWKRVAVSLIRLPGRRRGGRRPRGRSPHP